MLKILTRDETREEVQDCWFVRTEIAGFIRPRDEVFNHDAFDYLD